MVDEKEKNPSDDWGAQYVYLPDFTSEHIYSFLLYRLIVFKQSLSKKIALWREYV